jgi:HTH-type transcriptional regulator/antitoxin HigA
MMNIFPIHTRADHQKAMKRVSELMQLDPSPSSSESDELEVLAELIEAYEKKHHDLGSPTPAELIAFVMEQRGLTKGEMASYLGSPSRVSEVLNGKRALTLPMIRNLHVQLGLPLEPLVMGTASNPSSRPAKPRRSVVLRQKKATVMSKQRRVQSKAL